MECRGDFIQINLKKKQPQKRNLHMKRSNIISGGVSKPGSLNFLVHIN